MTKRNALLSIHANDKPKLDAFAPRLAALGFNLWASGGTCSYLRGLGLEVTDVATIVGGSASEGHLVVTISREIALGLLQPDTPETRATFEKDGLPFFDLLVATLYPIETEVRRNTATLESVRGVTDVGGPNMLHAGVKGRRIVLSNPRYWELALRWLEAGEPRRFEVVLWFAEMAERMASEHIRQSADFMSRELHRPDKLRNFWPGDISEEFDQYMEELHHGGTT